MLRGDSVPFAVICAEIGPLLTATVLNVTVGAVDLHGLRMISSTLATTTPSTAARTIHRFTAALCPAIRRLDAFEMSRNMVAEYFSEQPIA